MAGIEYTFHLIINATELNYQMNTNKGIIPEVKLVPEEKPRDTNGRIVLFLLYILGCKHILMARSMAEGPNIVALSPSVVYTIGHYLSEDT